MTTVLRVAGWILFAAGAIGLLALKGTILTYLSMGLAITGMILTIGSALILNIQRHRERARRLRELREARRSVDKNT